MNGVGFGAAFRWARAAFVKNTLSFIALSVVVMILQFGQQFAATPFTETLSLCVEAGGTGETIDSTAVSSCFESEMGQLLIVTLMAVVFVIAVVDVLVCVVVVVGVVAVVGGGGRRGRGRGRGGGGVGGVVRGVVVVVIVVVVVVVVVGGGAVVRVVVVFLSWWVLLLVLALVSLVFL